MSRPLHDNVTSITLFLANCKQCMKLLCHIWMTLDKPVLHARTRCHSFLFVRIWKTFILFL